MNQERYGYKNEQVLYELYLEHKISTTDMAEAFNISSTQTVCNWMEKFGIERRGNREAHNTERYCEKMSGESAPMYGTTRTFSEEHRRKISEANSNENNPFYGKTHSEEAKQKISEAHKGKTLSEETRRKISKALEGRVIPEEEIQKRSGENHPDWKGGHWKEFYGDRQHWIQQRQKRKKKDGYKCIECGMTEKDHKAQRGEELLIHHVIPRSEFDMFDEYKEAHSLDNLRSLCRSCHEKIEGHQRKFPEHHDTRDDEDEFEQQSAIDW